MDSASAPLPEGLVTFLLTDVEGSSRMWERDAEAMRAAMALHGEIVERAVAAAGGVRPVEQGEGDSVVVAFAQASQAVACALDLQLELQAADWPAGSRLRVRMALHTGEALLRDPGNYAGPAITRCARLRSIAHGGQTLLSRSTFELVAERLPGGAGVKPLGSHRLRDLARAEEVFELVHPELPTGFPPLRSLDALPNNLPAQLTSFVGRERELAEIGDLLGDSRLVALVGAGGCGKTRLAVQVAADRLDGFPEGAWWVDLAPLGDPGLVVGALGAALGLREVPGRPLLDTITDRLRADRALIVMDNCEHVVGEAARVCERLLRSCPEVRVLATSREPLGAEGEIDYRVPSLPVPGPDTALERWESCGAARLFVDRARAGRPGFVPTAESWPAIVAICSRLDGMPLALELAAARLRLLSPREIADGLGSRFALLAGGRRTALPRQQTLQHSIDWSYDLLDEGERCALRRAAVFAGGFDLEAAEAIIAGAGIDRYAVLDLLSRLVDKSLIQVERESPTARYRLLETIRQYAGQKLAEADDAPATRDRHLAHYLRLAELAAPAIEGREQLVWLRRLDEEHDNLRAAGDWAATRSDGDGAIRLAAALWLFWVYRGHVTEGRARLAAALAGEGGDRRVRGTALLALADTTLLVGDFAGAGDPAADALAVARETSDRRLEGRALLFVGWSELVTGGRGAGSALRAAADAARAVEDVFGVTFALNGLGMHLLYTGDPGGARPVLDEALALGRECGNRKAIAMALAWLGWLRLETGELAGAEDAFREGAHVAGELGDPVFLAWHHGMLAVLLMHVGDHEGARREIGRATAVGRAHPNPLITCGALAVRCWLEAWSGDPRAGLEAGEEAIRFGDALGLRRYSARWSCAYAQAAHAARDHGRASPAWEDAARRGREVDDPWVVGQATHGLAVLARERGELLEAESLAQEALRLLLGADQWTALVDLLESLAAIQLDLGAPELAARLLGAAEAERDRRGQPRPPALERRLAEDLERLRVPERAGDREAGSRLTLREVLAYASRGRGARNRPAAGWASLTPAELEVVRLVAEGLTNPQIGERLFVSRRTVQAHLAHVFRKLGVSNRAEVAAEVARRDASATRPA